MMTMPRLPLLAPILLAFVLLAATTGAAERTVFLARGVDLDNAGRFLRRAVTAWEAAADDPLPASWTPLSLGPGDSVSFGSRVFLQVQDAPRRGPATVMVVDDEGPHSGQIEPAGQARLGALRLLYATGPDRDGDIQMLVRASGEPELLLDPAARGGSKVSITGYQQPDRIVVAADDPRAVDFAASFLEGFNRGLDPVAAAREARADAPPRVASPRVAGAADQPARGPSRPMSAEEPLAALVTLRVVRAESAALSELAGAVAYDSAGASGGPVRVRAGAGPGGGGVSVGGPGDRFHARLRAFEASGRADVESETFVRVPLGGGAAFSFFGPSGGADGYIGAQRRGRDAVELDVDQRSGDWSFLGAVSQRVRVRDGGTVTLARHAYSRTARSSSGPPLVGQIPWVGPMIGGSSRSEVSSSYALFATVQLE